MARHRLQIAGRRPRLQIFQHTFYPLKFVDLKSARAFKLCRNSQLSIFLQNLKYDQSMYSHRTLGHLEALYCPHSGISGPKVTPMLPYSITRWNKRFGDERCEEDAMKGNLCVYRIWTDVAYEIRRKGGQQISYIIYKSIHSFKNGQQNSSGHILYLYVLSIKKKSVFDLAYIQVNPLVRHPTAPRSIFINFVFLDRCDCWPVT